MKEYQLKLIDSTYTVNDAREVIISLLNDKIKFLKMVTLRHQEHYGSSTPHLERRMQELLEEKEKLAQLLKPKWSGSELVKINCDVNIHLEEPEPVVA